MFSVKGSGKRNELKRVFVVREIEDGVTGVQEDGLPILTVDKPGWRRTTHSAMICIKLGTRSSSSEQKRSQESAVSGPNFDARGSRLANELGRRDYVTGES